MASAPFLPLTANARVEFYLADSAPDGSPPTGIERRQTQSLLFPATIRQVRIEQRHGCLARQPLSEYLGLPARRRLAGVCAIPGGPAQTDGVVILHSAFGTTGTAAAPFNLGRTATHEIAWAGIGSAMRA